MVFCSSIQENEQRENPSPHEIHRPSKKACDLISTSYWRSLMTFAVLSAWKITWINFSFNRKRGCFWMDDSFLESIFMRPQTTSGFCSEVFPIHPPRPLVFASSALFSWISLSCTLLFFHGHSHSPFVFHTKDFLETWIKQVLFVR